MAGTSALGTGQPVAYSPRVFSVARPSLLSHRNRSVGFEFSSTRPRPAAICRARRDATVSAAATEEDVENLVVIGSGPAGYTAAIYSGRANLKPVVFEGLQSGGVRGGQLMTTTDVENFPGFPDGITGPDLMDKMRQQADRWGAELFTEDVEFVDLSQKPYTVRSTEREVKTNSIIIATGATARRLGIPSEEEFWSKGISACAICDGASPLFKNREVAVVGGGDSATEEAVYLTKYAKHVHLLVRGPKMRASKTMIDRTLAHPKVTVHYNTNVVDAYGSKGSMSGLNVQTEGETKQLPVRGLFYGIGHKPNSDLVKDQVDLDEEGYVRLTEGVATNVDGVFAAGDLHDREFRQAITAAGSGCMAALSAERYLAAEGTIREFHAEREEPAAAKAVTTPKEEFDIAEDRHRGQFALRKLYHESDRILAVMYTSPQCGPCRTLKPMFSGVVDEYSGKMHYVEIDIEEDPEIAEAAGVFGTPVIQFFKNKERLHAISGVKMKRDYRKLIEEAL
ncbi:hypothetical protein BSKO_03154 [Bryopsis sp. KO-2023]|nr:hypothetical protein BSKO_03154 [Bryopsis sp. KO-2023]